MLSARISGRIKFFFYLFLFFFSLLTVVPLLWLLISSLKPHKQIIQNIFSLPTEWYFNNFLLAWELGNLGLYIVNSILYTLISSLITVYLALSIAYAFTKFPYRISGYINAFFMLGLLITVHAVLIPLFLLEVNLGIDNTYLGVILPYIAFGLPFLIYLATSYLKGLPDSIIESARLDGAGQIKIFHSIIIPLSMPIISTMLIFSMLGNWNEFIFVFVLTSDESLRSLPVGINAFAGGMARNYGLLFAALVIGIIPMLLFYVFFYNKIVEGVSAGALKE